MNYSDKMPVYYSGAEDFIVICMLSVVYLIPQGWCWTDLFIEVNWSWRLKEGLKEDFTMTASRLLLLPFCANQTQEAHVPALHKHNLVGIQ